MPSLLSSVDMVEGGNESGGVQGPGQPLRSFSPIRPRRLQLPRTSDQTCSSTTLVRRLSSPIGVLTTACPYLDARSELICMVFELG